VVCDVRARRNAARDPGLLNKDITQIVHEPAMVEQLKLMGAAPVDEGADQFKQFFHSELDRWAEVNKVAGLKAE
jgi:tripartite-type tricarboxylate transporter receptor subunit TctC